MKSAPPHLTDPGPDQPPRQAAELAVAEQTAQGPLDSGPDSSDSAELPWQPGQIVADRYMLQHLLGRGGHGAVFAATQVISGQAVALKLLYSGRDPKGMRRFEREAQVLARLRHVNTVRVLDAGYAASGSMYLAMELLCGETLETALQRRASHGTAGSVLPQAETLAVALQVLASLAEAHANGIIHRDIKPSNIMLVEQDGQKLVKLLDFGVATLVQRQGLGLVHATTDHVVGTPRYMSPEQCLGQPADARSDLYSLAVVLYRCVCGQLPFEDRAAVNTMYAHVHMPARDLASAAPLAVTSAFADVVMRALAKDPQRRFATAQEMHTALLAAEEAPTPAWSTGQNEQIRDWAIDAVAAHPPTPRDLAASLGLGALAAAGPSTAPARARITPWRTAVAAALGGAALTGVLLSSVPASPAQQGLEAVAAAAAAPAGATHASGPGGPAQSATPRPQPAAPAAPAAAAAASARPASAPQAPAQAPAAAAQPTQAAPKTAAPPRRRSFRPARPATVASPLINPAATLPPD